VRLRLRAVAAPSICDETADGRVTRQCANCQDSSGDAGGVFSVENILLAADELGKKWRSISGRLAYWRFSFRNDYLDLDESAERSVSK